MRSTTYYILVALSASQGVLAGTRAGTSLNSRQTTCSCQENNFLAGICSSCSLQGSSCSCPDTNIQNLCNNEQLLCSSYSLDEECKYLPCSVGASGVGSGGGGGGGGSSDGGSTQGSLSCKAGYKPCAGVSCIPEDEVCCGRYESGTRSCPKGRVCIESGEKTLCRKEGGDDGDKEEEDGSTTPVAQSGAASGTGTAKSDGSVRSMTVMGWVGVLGIVVGGFFR